MRSQSVELFGRSAALVDPLFHLPCAQHTHQCDADYSFSGSESLAGTGQVEKDRVLVLFERCDPSGGHTHLELAVRIQRIA
jgi:hypothetical protein